ncbi:MAG: GDP-L-fucose synthase [Roseivirga sp.]|nr:GDP-L-fucose synthase [Roseivirga sp.]
MNKNDKIYVAGHNGMVGSALVRHLLQEDFENIVTRTSKELDLRNTTSVMEFFKKEKPDFVFLAAAKVGGIVANNTYRADFLYENLMIQNNVIHAAHTFKTKRLQFLGSSCIYPKLAPQPIKEDYLLTGLLEPTNEPYAIAKIAGIKLCETYRDQYGDDFHSVMPTNLYGPNDNYDLQKSHVLPALIRKLFLASLLEKNEIEKIKNDLKSQSGFEGDVYEFLNQQGISIKEGGVEVRLWGSGSPLREFLHVDDLAKGCVFLMKASLKASFLNIGKGEDLSIKELAEKVKYIVGFEGAIAWDDTKPDGTPRKLMDSSKMFDLGWKPEIELDEGIQGVFENYLKTTENAIY